MPTTAVAIAGYNRPHYFRPSVRSLLTNRLVTHTDLWCFWDGGPNACQAVYTAILSEELSLAQFSPQNVYVIERPQNFGCERNLIDLRRQLFDRHGYENVFVFEDDLVISSHYLKLCQSLLSWASHRYTDIGVVQAYNDCLLSPQEKHAREDEVQVGNPHWWGYLMPRSTWQGIFSTLYEYEERFVPSGNRRLDHAAIRAWAQQKLDAALHTLTSPADLHHGDRPFPSRWTFEPYFTGEFATGQDAMTVLAMALAGRQKLFTTVNRARPIGQEGLHSTPAFFAAARLDQITLEEFPEDANRESFVLCRP